MVGLMWKCHTLVTATALILSLAGCRARREVALDLLQMQDQAVVFEDTQRIDLGTQRGRAHLSGSSWSGDEKDQLGRTFVWAMTHSAPLNFSVVKPRDLFAIVNCRPFPRDGAMQTLSLTLNDEPVGKPVELQSDFNEYKIFLPARLIKAGSNRLGLGFAYAGAEQGMVEEASGTKAAQAEKRPLAACFDYVDFKPYDDPEGIRAAGEAPRPSLEAIGLRPADVLVQASGSTISYYIRLPESSVVPRAEFECGVPREFGGKSAAFSITVENDGGGSPQSVYERTLQSGQKKSASADLAAWGGKVVRLSFVLNGSALSAVWVKPRITIAPRPGNKEDERITDARKKLAKSNLLVILLDAASAGHFGCHGYPLDTTPTIDRLAREGIQFTNAYCNAVYTSASTGSLMSGYYPDVHRVLFSKNRLPTSAYTLPEMLASRGFRTAAFIANSNAGALRGYEQGFHDYYELFRYEEFGSLCENQNQWLFPWLEKNKANQFFLYLHFREPHFGGLPPQRFLDKFNTGYSGTLDVLNDREKINRGERALNDAELRHIVSVYDATLNYADYEIGIVMQKLKELGILDNTLTIVLADHGEALWEHGYFGHNVQVYQNMAHIPFVVKPPAALAPEALAPRKIDSVIQTVDLYATIADITGSADAASRADGSSLLPMLVGDGASHAGLAYTRTLWTTPTYAIRDGRWEYVFATRNGSAELYDLQADPGEKTDQLSAHPFIGTYFQRHLQHWVAQQKVKARAISSPEAAQMDEATRQNLGGLGYVDTTTGKDIQEQEKAPD